MYVIAPEGIYTVVASKAFALGIQTDVTNYYSRHKKINMHCRRPLATLIRSDTEPLLHRLFSETATKFRDLISDRALNTRERIEAYAGFLNGLLGVSLKFQAWKLPLREATGKDWNVRDVILQERSAAQSSSPIF